MLEGVNLFVVIALKPYQSGRAQPLESGFKGVVVLARNSRQRSRCEKLRPITDAN